MRASLCVEVDGDRVVRLRGAPPLAARVVPAGSCGPASIDGPAVVLVGTAAGLLEGDAVLLHLLLGPGARLAVFSVAATLAHPCPGGGTTAFDVVAELGAGARLAWLPEPLVSFARSDHRGRSEVRLADGATALWREEVVLGRTGEAGGRLRVSTVADHGGRALLRDGLDTTVAGWDGPAVTSGARYVGTASLLGADVAGDPAPLLPLGGAGATARVLANDATTGRAALADSVERLVGSLPR